MKLKHDVAFCFDWFVIDQCGLVAPFVESFGDGRKQAGRTEDLVYVCDVAVLGDGGFDANCIGRAGRNLRGLWIDPRNQLTDDYFFISVEGPSRVGRGQ